MPSMTMTSPESNGACAHARRRRRRLSQRGVQRVAAHATGPPTRHASALGDLRGGAPGVREVVRQLAVLRARHQVVLLHPKQVRPQAHRGTGRAHRTGDEARRALSRADGAGTERHEARCASPGGNASNGKGGHLGVAGGYVAERGRPASARPSRERVNEALP